MVNIYVYVTPSNSISHAIYSWEKMIIEYLEEFNMVRQFSMTKIYGNRYTQLENIRDYMLILRRK